MPTRLLLVEFAVIGRFHRAAGFPLIHGLAKRDGVESLWLRFAVPPDVRMLSDAEGASLPPADEGRLRALAARFGPNHVLFSSGPSAALSRALAEAAPDARSAAGLCAAEVPAFLGLPRPRRAWTEGPAAAYDYGWTAGNPEAESLDPLPFVTIGAECSYAKPFADNPFFQGADLSRSIRRGGCSFCARPEHERRPRGDFSRLLAAQLRAIDKTSPRPRGGRLRIRLSGERFIEEIEAAARLLRRLDLRPADLLLDSRADALLRRAGRFERALRMLEGTGHRFSLSLIGIESFCGAELGRYNKGLTPCQNLETVRRLFEWEARFPRCFCFKEDGGLSLIGFNPWTRPHEADLNIAVAELTETGGAMGKLLSGRLRLIPGLPLEAKARQDGLLSRSSCDPLLETARRNFYEAEVPWRFQAPEMEAVGRLLTRFQPEGSAAADPLSRAVRSLLDDAARRGLAPLRLAHFVILAAQQAAWAGRSSSRPQRILGRVRGWAARESERGDGGMAWVAPGSVTPQSAARALAAKPVAKVEPIRERDLAAWRALDFLPNAKLRRRGWGKTPEPVWELFYGRRPGDVEAAVGMSDKIVGETSASATREVGRLLGYPECCVRAHARRAGGVQANIFWGHVANRVAKPGPVPPELNPARTPIVHVPCSLRCAASLRQARRSAAGVGGLENPWLLVWGGEGACVELLAHGEPGERLRYRAGGSSGDSPDIDAIRSGDELALEEETMLVLKKGRPYASLSGRAFLWWHKRSFQTDFWRAMVALRSAVPMEWDVPRRPDAAAGAQAPCRPVAPSVQARCDSLLQAADRDFRHSRGISCRSRYDGEFVQVTLKGKEYGLFLAPKSKRREGFFAALPSFYVLLHGELAMTGEEQELLKSYLSVLSRQDAGLKKIL